LPTTATPKSSRFVRDSKLLVAESVKVSVIERLARAALDDLRQSSRWIRRHPSTSFTVFLTMAMALAAALVAFRIIHATILRPLPFPGPDRVVNVRVTGPTISRDVHASSRPDFEDWRERGQSFAQLSAHAPATFRLTERGEPREIEAVRVMPGFDRVLGRSPLMGRFFEPGDYAAPEARVAVLTHSFWRSEFAGDPTSIGRTLLLDGRSYEVVGVLPDLGLNFPAPRHDVWVPLIPRTEAFWEHARNMGWLSVVGRIRGGVSLTEAQAELTSVAGILAREHPNTNREKTVAELVPVSEQLVGPATPILTVLGAALVAVLLIACGNIANLLLASSSRRRREFAVRTALGAHGIRLARQIVGESLLLCGAAAAVAIAVSPSLTRAFISLYPTPLPRDVTTGFDLATALAASGFATFAALLLAAPQIAQSRRPDIRLDMAGTGRATETRRERAFRATLVTTQVALSFALIVAGISLVRTLSRLTHVDTGYRSEGVMTFLVNPPPAPPSDTALPFYESLVNAIDDVPGVRAVAAAVAAPMTSSGWRFGVRPSNASAGVLVGVNLTSSQYFDALGIRVREGRLLTSDEQRRGVAVAVVNEQLARLLGGNVIGRRFDYSNTRWEVVGVVEGVRHVRPRDEPIPELFIPWHNAGRRPQSITVRADGDPMSLLPAIAARVRTIDPTLPLMRVARLDDRLRQAVAAERFRASLLASLAMIAIVLAALGAYSVTAYSVSRRTREYGIRLALGERPISIWRRALSAGVGPAIAGVVLGAAISWSTARWLESFLYQVSARDATTLAATAGALILLALLSAASSARRAATLDPARILSTD
jgi:putative ABC transport system permease protein